MADFQSFLLSNINLLGLKESSGSSGSSDDGNCVNAVKAAVDDNNNHEAEYRTTSTTASLIHTANTSGTNKNSVFGSVSCNSDSSSNSTVGSDDYKERKNEIAKKSLDTDDSLNYSALHDDEPIVPRRRMKPSKNELDSFTRLNEHDEDVHNSERDSERDAHSPKPLRSTSITNRLLNKLKNHDFSPIKSIFNSKMDDVIEERPEPVKQDIPMRKLETPKPPSNERQKVEEKQESTSDTSDNTDLSKLVSLISLLTQNNLKIEEEQISALSTALGTNGTSSISSLLKGLTAKKNEPPVSVQKPSQMKCKNLPERESRQKPKCILESSYNHDDDDEDDDEIGDQDETVSFSEDISEYSWLKRSSTQSSANTTTMQQSDHHLYNEINELEIRRKLIKGNLMSDAEDTDESLHEFDDDFEVLYEEDEEEEKTEETKTNEDDEDEDEDDVSECENEEEKKSKRLLKKRLNELAKLKRPERRILYNEWFKIIKKLQTDPKFDLETLIRTRGRFTDHVMISYRDRLLKNKYRQHNSYLRNVKSEPILDVFDLKNSAADLNFFKENQHHRMRDKDEEDDDEKLYEEIVNKMRHVQHDSLNKAFKLTLRKNDINLIKEKLTKNRKPLIRLLGVFRDENKPSNSNAKKTDKIPQQQIKEPYKQVVKAKQANRQAKPIIENDDEEECDEFQEEDDDDETGLKSKFKNLKHKSKMESAKDFCDGLSKIVKGKIENKLKPLKNAMHKAEHEVEPKSNKDKRSSQQAAAVRQSNRKSNDDAVDFDKGRKHRSATVDSSTSRSQYNKGGKRLSNINEDSFHDETRSELKSDSEFEDESSFRTLQNEASSRNQNDTSKRMPPPRRPPPPRPLTPKRDADDLIIRKNKRDQQTDDSRPRQRVKKDSTSECVDTTTKKAKTERAIDSRSKQQISKPVKSTSQIEDKPPRQRQKPTTNHRRASPSPISRPSPSPIPVANRKQNKNTTQQKPTSDQAAKKPVTAQKLNSKTNDKRRT